MYTLVRCPTCGIQANAHEQFAGLKLTCAECEGEIHVPDKLPGRFRKTQWRKEKANTDRFWKRNQAYSGEWKAKRKQEVFHHNMWVVFGFCSLLLLGLSQFLSIIYSIKGKSVTGMSGDGIIIFMGTAIILSFFLFVVLTDRHIDHCLLLAGAWGTLASVWLIAQAAIFYWIKMTALSHAQSGIAVLLIANVSTGIGLYIGLGGGIGLIISSSTLQQSYNIGRKKIILSHIISISIGVIIFIGLYFKGSMNLFF